MNALRRFTRRPQPRVAAFADPAFQAKQDTRDQIARAIAEQFSAPIVFVMPSYQALCAKTINGLVPDAVFYGTDYYRTVAEKTDAVAPGKTINMQHKSVKQYIETNTGSKFDAAFLDYKTYYSYKAQEIKDFASKMLKEKAVLAITVQRGNLNVRTLEQDLQQVARTVVLKYHLEYETTTPMLNAVFYLEK